MNTNLKVSKNLLLKTYQYTALALQALVTLFFFLGAASFSAGPITPISAITDMITPIKHIRYTKIAGACTLGLGIAYIPVAVVLIKNLIAAITPLHPKENTTDEDKIFLYSYNMLKASAMVIIYSLLVKLLDNSGFSGMFVWTIVLAMIVLISSRVIIFYMRNYSIKSIALDTAFLLLPIAALFIFFASSITPAFEELSFLLSGLFVTGSGSGFLTTGIEIVEISFYIAVFSQFLSYTIKMMGYTSTEHHALQSATKSMLTTAIIYSIVPVVKYAAIVDFEIEASYAIDAFAPALPILFCIIALRVTSSIPAIQELRAVPVATPSRSTTPTVETAAEGVNNDTVAAPIVTPVTTPVTAPVVEPVAVPLTTPAEETATVAKEAPITNNTASAYTFYSNNVNPFASAATTPTFNANPAPAEVVTEATAEAPAEVVTEAPAEAPAEVVTAAPTEAPAEVVTEAPAEAPAEVVAEAPAEAPAEETATIAKEAPITNNTASAYTFYSNNVNPFASAAATPTFNANPAPAEVVTAAPAEAPAEVVAEATAEAPAEVVTAAPTEAPAEVVTEAPAEAPAEIVTEAPAEAPAEVVTETPTEAPAEVKTTATASNTNTTSRYGSFYNNYSSFYNSGFAQKSAAGTDKKPDNSSGSNGNK